MDFNVDFAYKNQLLLLLANIRVWTSFEWDSKRIGIPTHPDLI